MVRDGEQRAACRGSGSLDELHAGFLRGPPGFLSIAVHAGADDVFPCMLPSPVTRYHVVERQVPTLLSAVLAGVLVPVEYLVACHLALSMRSPYQLGEADDGRQLVSVVECVDIAESVLQHLRFALVDEDDGATGAADGERLVALVQH